MRLRELAHERVRFGYRRLQVLLGREGVAVNHKCVYRLYREEGLAVRKRKRKRVAVARTSLPRPTALASSVLASMGHSPVTSVLLVRP